MNKHKKTMIYDDWSWHTSDDDAFPEDSDLDPDAGGTHIGMFLAWCLLNGLASKHHLTENEEQLEILKDREKTPGQWLLDHASGRFTDEDVTELGNKFALVYYNTEESGYLQDYIDTVGDPYDNIYEVPDTWATYDELEPIISERFDIFQDD